MSDSAFGSVLEHKSKILLEQWHKPSHFKIIEQNYTTHEIELLATLNPILFGAFACTAVSVEWNPVIKY